MVEVLEDESPGRVLIHDQWKQVGVRPGWAFDGLPRDQLHL